MPSTATKDGMALELAYTEAQDAVFNDPHRYVCMAKGRRCGGTRGAAQHVVERMLDGGLKVLWVDTIQANLSLYFQRYFLPILSRLDNSLWSWNEQKKLLQVLDSYLDMRSAEKPQNFEGFGYGLVICNESGIIFNGRKSLWENTIAPMTMDYGAKVFFIGTPKGKKDKNGEEHLFFTFFKRAGDPEWPDWSHWQFSTYDNPFLRKKDIQDMEQEVPSAVRRQEVYAEFVDISEDSIFKAAWWKYGDSVPNGVVMRLLSLDTAFKTGSENDYSACTAWERTVSQYWCTDAWQERLAFPDLIAKVRATQEAFKADMILIEDAASGQSLIQTLQAQGLPVTPYKVDRDKIARAVACTPLIEQGSVFFKKGPWNAMVVDQCEAFPLGEYMDLVDTVSQALNYMKANNSGELRPVIHHRVVRKASFSRQYGE